jgi:hypothetical protein
VSEANGVVPRSLAPYTFFVIPLPLATDLVRCSDFARANQIDPGGTALAPDVLIVVEVPEPWPKPAGKHPQLVQLVAEALDHPEQVRLLAAVPHDLEAPRVIALRRTAGGMTRAELPVGDDPSAAMQSVLRAETPVWVGCGDDAPRTMLVCTQGSHDECCGTDGAVFAKWVEEQRPDVELFRVSHTGGHRFAPTAMTLPDGRMWAYLTPELADGILDRSMEPAELAHHCRGWWGAPTGPAQVAERAVFALSDFSIDSADRAVGVVNAGSPCRVIVEVGDTAFEVIVGSGREVPTIACAAPGGEPVKSGREWVVLDGPNEI